MAEQSRKFCGILYPDAENHDCDHVLDVIKNYFDDWAFILHDKDVIENSGELKKAHYHWVGSLKNPVLISTVINRLEVPAQAVEYVKKTGDKVNWKGAVRYLVHNVHPEKYQYDVQDVISNFDITKFLTNNDDVVMIKKIIAFVDANPGCTWRSVFEFSVANGCYAEFRRGQTIIKDIIKESKGESIV